MKVTGKGHNLFTGEGRTARASLAVLSVVGVVALTCTGVASAAPVGGGHQPSAWGESAATEAGPAPSLSNDVGKPTAGGGAQLPAGLCLLGIGALGLVVGLAAMPGRSRGRLMEPGSAGSGWRPPRDLPSGTGARP